MADGIWIDGRHEWVENAEAFALIIDEKLGREAADLFRSYLSNSEKVKDSIEEALDILRDVDGMCHCDDRDLDRAITILEELTA